jgi:inhibitor of KinA
MSYSGEWEIRPLNESTVVIYFGSTIELSTLRRITACNEHLKKFPFDGLRETVPAYTSLAVIYDPLVVKAAHTLVGEFAFSRVENFLHQLLHKITDLSTSDKHVNGLDPVAVAGLPSSNDPIGIPVAYGGGYGPDLDFVAKHNRLTTDEVIFLHTEPVYTVYMIGFLPGFPYLGGMNKAIACPRKQTPGKLVASGSVGIGGEQTGVYPMQSPGGWQLIGRTPLPLFNASHDPPALLSAGATVKFVAISPNDFSELSHADAVAST